MFRSIQALMDPNFRLKIKCREGHKLRKQLEYWTIEADRQDPVHNRNYDPRPYIRAEAVLESHNNRCETRNPYHYYSNIHNKIRFERGTQRAVWPSAHFVNPNTASFTRHYGATITSTEEFHIINSNNADYV